MCSNKNRRSGAQRGAPRSTSARGFLGRPFALTPPSALLNCIVSPSLPRSGVPLSERERLPHIDPRLPQEPCDTIRFHARSVKLHPHRALLLVELYPSHSVDFAHPIDSPQLFLAGRCSVTKNDIQISHAIILCHRSSSCPACAE